MTSGSDIAIVVGHQQDILDLGDHGLIGGFVGAFDIGRVASDCAGGEDGQDGDHDDQFHQGEAFVVVNIQCPEPLPHVFQFHMYFSLLFGLLPICFHTPASKPQNTILCEWDPSGPKTAIWVCFCAECALRTQRTRCYRLFCLFLRVIIQPNITTNAAIRQGTKHFLY